VRKVGEDLRPASFREVCRDQHKMQLALAAAESVAPDEENAGLEDEGKEPFNRFGLGHLKISILVGACFCFAADVFAYRQRQR